MFGSIVAAKNRFLGCPKPFGTRKEGFQRPRVTFGQPLGRIDGGGPPERLLRRRIRGVERKKETEDLTRRWVGELGHQSFCMVQVRVQEHVFGMG